MPLNTEKTSKLDALNALNELVVNCPELPDMEKRIGGFNLFSILGAESGELRHSNTLSWFFDPEESHGLRDSFLQRWLMTVLHEANTKPPGPPLPTPVDVDCWNLVSVEVRREWKHIDILIILTMSNKKTWVVAIENKVNAKQGKNQLKGYREVVQDEFSCSEKIIYIFLTKDDEEPKDDHYIPASYSQVHSALQQSSAALAHSIGNEPRVLIDNYLRLLEEKFMDDSEISQLAQKIYKQHKRALDLIIYHKPDNLKSVSDKLYKLLEKSSQELGIIMEHSSKGYVRFIPSQWDESNSDGSAWSGERNRTILFEIPLSETQAKMVVMSGKAPNEWIAPLWEESHSKPFMSLTGSPKTRAKHWVTLHSVKLKPIKKSEDFDSDQVAQNIFEQVETLIATENIKKVIRYIQEKLPSLAKLYKDKKSL